jgi:acetyltransferase-like isoleucine patch superfamily enzyme
MGDFLKNRHSYGDIKVFFRGKVYAGAFCQIADGVCAVMEGHRPEYVSMYPFTGRHFQDTWGSNPDYGRVTNGDIYIGSDVWIGQDALFLSGVKIGDGAVIGARTVVSKDVPPYSIAIGAPMQIKRKRFTDKQIESLLKIKWWTWADEKIKAMLPYILSSDVDEFIRKAGG